MGRTENFYVESICVVPPIIEWCRQEHRERSPNHDPCAQWRAKSPEAYGRRAFFRRAEEMRLERQPSASQAGNESTEISEDVRGRPKGIAADGTVPGNVPMAAHHGKGDGGGAAPDVPRHGFRISGNWNRG